MLSPVARPTTPGSRRGQKVDHLDLFPKRRHSAANSQRPSVRNSSECSKSEKGSCRSEKSGHSVTSHRLMSARGVAKF